MESRKYPKERDTCRVAGAAGVPTAKIAFFAEMQARAGDTATKSRALSNGEMGS